MNVIYKGLVIPDEGNLESNLESWKGIRPENRPISELLRIGIINLDKPAGPTSHDVVATVKKILGVSKAGHAGTLDPNVSGVLPIALNASTRLVSYLHELPKVYVCNMAVQLNGKEVEWTTVFGDFLGQIYQFPPLESNVARRLRKRTIHSLDLLDTNGNDILFEVKCQSGTYIRTLCIDMGRAIGLPAYMKELRRIQTATFTEEERVTLHNLFDAWMDYTEDGEAAGVRKVILPVERMVSHLKEVIVDNGSVKAVANGSPLGSVGVLAYSPEIEAGELIATKTVAGELIGIGRAMETGGNFEDHGRNVFRAEKVVYNKANL